MIRLGKRSQTPTEEKRYVIDYTEWLDTGETISTKAFAVSPSGGLSVSSSAIESGSKKVSFFVTGGDDNVTYSVVATITTSGGQRKQVEILFAVKN